ncbi:hypothetical protein ZWY2020_017629 [Hordeum vulgare]|nr:hypothetical protein ZWY2020_017629 [Hordeum vulgare]
MAIRRRALRWWAGRSRSNRRHRKTPMAARFSSLAPGEERRPRARAPRRATQRTPKAARPQRMRRTLFVSSSERLTSAVVASTRAEACRGIRSTHRRATSSRGGQSASRCSALSRVASRRTANAAATSPSSSASITIATASSSNGSLYFR